MFAGFTEEEIGQFRIYLDRVIFNATGEENYSYKRPRRLKGDEDDGEE